MNKFRHGGCLGDIIYALPSVLYLKGGEFLIDPYKPPRPLGMSTTKMLCDLLETQPYIKKTSPRENNEDFTHDLDFFRDNLSYRRHLALSHWLGLDLPQKDYDIRNSWMTIEPLEKAAIIITRTPRRKGVLNWSLLEPHKNDCLFIGFEYEWKDFPIRIDFYQPKNLIEYAQIVSGAKLVIANQTFTFALAEALKKKRVLEVAILGPNCMPEKGTGGEIEIEALLSEVL